MRNVLRFFWFVAFMFSLVASTAIANEGLLPKVADEKNVLSMVDHSNKILVVNDKVYKIPINMQVYILDPSDGTKRKVNRYALKAGQEVYIRSKVKDRQRYVQRIIIAQY